MMRYVRLAASLLGVISIVAPAFAFAQQAAAPPSTAQIERLEKQLADVQRQLAEMRKVIHGANLSSEQRQDMMGHMGTMQQGWQGMHQQCCMMDPAHCPQTGMGGMNPGQ